MFDFGAKKFFGFFLKITVDKKDLPWYLGIVPKRYTPEGGASLINNLNPQHTRHPPTAQ